MLRKQFARLALGEAAKGLRLINRLTILTHLLIKLLDLQYSGIHCMSSTQQGSILSSSALPSGASNCTALAGLKKHAFGRGRLGKLFCAAV